MTDKPMRERMISALDTATAEWVKAQGGDKGMADMPTEVLVDALLDVLETPSEAVLHSMCLEWDTTPPDQGQLEAAHDGVKAIVKAIRDGA